MVLSNIIHFVYFSLGSCIEQGLTTCSSGPEYYNNYDDYSGYNYDLDCFCDEVCLSLRDCCTDIYQLEYCGEGKLCCHLKISDFKNNYRVHHHNFAF